MYNILTVWGLVATLSVVFTVIFKAYLDFKKEKMLLSSSEAQRVLNGLEGISSITLTPKRYVELLKAEEELLEVMLKLNKHK